jgi:hypothetical protein
VAKRTDQSNEAVFSNDLADSLLESLGRQAIESCCVMKRSHNCSPCLVGVGREGRLTTTIFGVGLLALTC